MKMLGHGQIGLTMNTYAHVLPEIERAAVDAATRHLFDRRWLYEWLYSDLRSWSRHSYKGLYQRK
jgi:hypothetical protein